jgi:hypothetical protein
MHQAVTQIEGIQAALVGAFYSRFSVDTGFDFHFENFVLSANDVLSPDEAGINSAFVANYPPASHTATPEVIAKSAVVAACLGAEISAVEVLADSSLVLRFNNDVEIKLPTNTPVVDWHWAITEQGGDPYMSCLVACFSPGDIQGCMPNNSFKPTPLRGAA